MANETEIIDLNTLPTDIDVPSTLTSEQGALQADAAIQMISFPFCLAFSGRAWMTRRIPWTSLCGRCSIRNFPEWAIHRTSVHGVRVPAVRWGLAHIEQAA